MSTNYDNKRSQSAVQILQVRFRKRPVLTIDELSKAVKATERTVFRVLKEMDYLSSFSHAGRYYTLRPIPSFDSQGLWFYDNIGFSKHGNLRATIIVLVKEASAGHTHEELQAKLQLRVHNTLADLVRDGLVNREQVDAVYVYVNPNSKIAKTQVERRRAMIKVPQIESSTLGVADVVEILLVVIRKPGASIPQIRGILGTKNIIVSDREIADVLDRYDLKKKIKNSLSKQSKK
jgi:hypothetical protein